MLKHRICFSLIVLPLFVFSQEIKFATGIGYTIAEINESKIKKVLLCREWMIGTEWPIRQSPLRVKISVGLRNMEFDFTEQTSREIFNRKTYVVFPFSILRYYKVSGKSSLFWDFGANASLLFLDRREVRFNQAQSLHKSWKLGWNLGAHSRVGFRTMINNRMSFDVGYFSGKDLLLKYKESNKEMKTTTKMLVSSISIIL